jgi:hypothetical protein
MIGGIISDKYERKNYMTKSLICMIGALLAIPIVGIATIFQ